MARSRSISIVFPVGGVHKRFGFHKQAPFTTPSADNVWPTQWETGRERGGVRPGITSFGSAGGTPYNWCRASWVDSGTKVGIAVTHSSGTSVRTASDSWTSRISTAPGSDFSSCAVYLQKLYQARSGGTCLWNALTGSAGSGTELTATMDKGTAPINCGLVVAWGDRLVLAGDSANPHVVYMSHVNDPNDWDYSAADEDSGAAWATAGSTGGLIGDPVTSLIPHNEDCLLVGCTDSIYAINGNPILSSKPVYSLSHTVGPLMQSAWCKTSNDFTVFMTRDGLYSMRPGCGEPPTSMSRENLPTDLTAIDPGAGDKVAVGYDNRWRGIHIYVDRAGSGTDSHWFYSMESKGYWPMSFSTGTMRLAATLESATSETKSGLIAIKSSGTAYQFDIESSEKINSHLYYGPIAVGSPHAEGVVSEITAVLSEDSGEANWELYASESPNKAFHLDTPSFRGSTWTRQGLNHAQNPSARGSAMYLKVSDSNRSRWVIEEISAVIRQAGRRRIG